MGPSHLKSVFHSGWCSRWGTAGLVALFAAVVTVFSIAGAARSEDPSELIKPKALVGLKVDVETKSGESLRGFEVLKVGEDRVAGAIRAVTLRNPADGKTQYLLAPMIATLSPGEGQGNYTFDASTKRLLPDNATRGRIQQELKDADSKTAEAQAESQRARKSAEKPAEVDDPKSEEQAEKGGAKEDGKQPKSAKKSAADDTRKNAAKVIDIPLRPGVKPWPEQTKADREAAIAEHKEFLKKSAALFPHSKFQLTETDYFLFFSDLPPQELRLYVPYMDAMYKQLAGMFQLKAGTNVWRGKAPMIILANKAEYVEFEMKMCNANENQANNSAGLCHYESNGNVLMSGFGGPGVDRRVMAGTLVHETVHGFLYRYKTRQWVPSWVNEGCAVFIQDVIVPGNVDVRAKEQEAVLHMQRGNSMGGDFFTDKWVKMQQGTPQMRLKYGVASNLTRYMVASDARRYRMFIEGIKAGMNDGEALENAFGTTKEQMALQYGKAIGAANLKP